MCHESRLLVRRGAAAERPGPGNDCAGRRRKNDVEPPRLVSWNPPQTLVPMPPVQSSRRHISSVWMSILVCVPSLVMHHGQHMPWHISAGPGDVLTFVEGLRLVCLCVHGIVDVPAARRQSRVSKQPIRSSS